MDKKLRKIDYKGDTYISSEDLRELLEEANSMDELREALFPKKEKEELSDFNQKLVKGLGFNPNAKKEFSMRKFPVVGILKDGEEVTDLEHPLINRHVVNISKCQVRLNKIVKPDETATIYVYEENNSVVYKISNGDSFTYYE